MMHGQKTSSQHEELLSFQIVMPFNIKLMVYRNMKYGLIDM